MSTVQELREYCENLQQKRQEELKTALEDYFSSTLIKWHKPFRAWVGRKASRTIFLPRVIMYASKEAFGIGVFKAPNMSEEMLRKELENLGFVVEEDQLYITVPPCEKGKKLSFAQELARKVNYSYSRYCAAEKKRAQELHSKFISELLATNPENVEVGEGYTIFHDFKFEYELTAKCATFMRRLMKQDGIEEYFEKEKYKGIKVINQPQTK